MKLLTKLVKFNKNMEKSLQILQRELTFINERIRLIRRGDVRIDRGISLKDALIMQKDLENAIKLLEKNL